MASIGTPYDLYKAYRNLNVRLFGDHIILAIDVHEYRNNELGGDFSTVAAVAEYNRLKAKVQSHGTRVGNGLYELYYPLMKNSERKKNPQAPISDYMLIDVGFPLYNVFVGKGSPKQIADALKLAVAFVHITGTLHAMQDYCDKYIGLDCSGFASNFFGLSPKEVCNMGAGKMAPVAKRVRRLEDVRVGTAIVFKSGKHVSVVDQISNVDRTGNTAYAIDCKVAESTADQMVQGGPSDGLNYTDYVLLVENNKYDPTIFKILRPLAGNKNGFYGVDVHLANWPEYNFWD
jgi:hypothetical protein